MARKNKAEMKQKATRVICLVLAGLMIGSTVLAAVLEGYAATGIEVTDHYAELARERIRKEYSYHP